MLTAKGCVGQPSLLSVISQSSGLCVWSEQTGHMVYQAVSAHMVGESVGWMVLACCVRVLTGTGRDSVCTQVLYPLEVLGVYASFWLLACAMHALPVHLPALCCTPAAGFYLD